MQLSNVLRDGYEAVLSYLADSQQSENSRGRYQAAYWQLTEFFNKEGRETYNSVTNQDFRDAITKEAANSKISKRQCRLLFRMSAMIDSYYQGKPIQHRYSYGNRFKCKLVKDSEILIDEFGDWLTVADNSVAGYKTAAREFLFYLQENRINDLNLINMQTLSDYLIHVSATHKASMNNVLVSLRRFLLFLKEQSLCSCHADQLIPFKTAPTHRKIYTPFNSDELGTLLSAPDLKTVMGIRDYAILLLASCTGIRAIDIANLKLADIDRESMSISFIQHKTSRENTLPVDRKVLEAVDAYVRVRTNTGNPYVFQTVNNPPRKLNDISSVRNILLKYLRSTGIKKVPWDGKGFHAFRRGMGVWLLESSQSFEMIVQVLGHKDNTMLRHYLPLSTSSLKKCALDFELAPMKSEVYR